jgi:CBS domain-containing protein
MQDRTAIGEKTGGAASALQTEMSLEFSETELTVADIMTETIISVRCDERVTSAIQEMAKYKISCIIVTNGGRPVGILTERDILRGVATRYEDFTHANVAEEMSQPVISVDPDTTALNASTLMTSKDIKRLLVVSQQQPLGVVTQTDITSALISMAPFRNIADLMTRDVVTIDETATTTEAAQLMAAYNISCVVALRGDIAVGIVTEKDIVQRLALSHDDPSATPVAEIMSFPVMSVPATHSVMSASRVMDQMHIHRLLVGSTTDILGIVTQTDIIVAVRRKLQEARKARLQQRSEMGHLAESALKNLSSIQCLFRGVLLCQQSAAGAAHTAEQPGDGPLRDTVVSNGDQDDAACWYDSILKQLETQISEAQDCLTHLAGISETLPGRPSDPS